MSDLVDDLKTVASYMSYKGWGLGVLDICIKNVGKLEKDYKNILQKSKNQSMDIMGLSEMCDRLEKQNELFKATLNDLLNNYTVVGEDAYNLIQEALK